MTQKEEAEILDQLGQLESAKKAIREAINETNVEVGSTTPLINYADAIRNIAKGPGLGGTGAMGLVNSMPTLPKEGNYGGGMSYKNAWKKDDVAKLVISSDDWPDEPTTTINTAVKFREWAMTTVPNAAYAIVEIVPNQDAGSDGWYDVDAIMKDSNWIGYINLNSIGTQKLFGRNGVGIKWAAEDLINEKLADKVNAQPDMRHLFVGGKYVQNFKVELGHSTARVARDAYLIRGFSVTCKNNTVKATSPFAGYDVLSRIYFESWAETTAVVDFLDVNYTLPATLMTTQKTVKDVVVKALSPIGCEKGFDSGPYASTLERVWCLGLYTMAAIDLDTGTDSVDKFYVQRVSGPISKPMYGVKAQNVSNGLINDFFARIDGTPSSSSGSTPGTDPLKHKAFGTEQDKDKVHYAFYAGQTVKGCKLVRGIGHKTVVYFGEQAVEENSVVSYSLYGSLASMSSNRDRANSVFQSKKIRRNVAFNVSVDEFGKESKFEADQFRVFVGFGPDSVIEDNYLESLVAEMHMWESNPCVQLVAADTVANAAMLVFSKNIIGKISVSGHTKLSTKATAIATIPLHSELVTLSVSPQNVRRLTSDYLPDGINRDTSWQTNVTTNQSLSSKVPYNTISGRQCYNYNPGENRGRVTYAHVNGDIRQTQTHSQTHMHSFSKPELFLTKTKIAEFSENIIGSIYHKSQKLSCPYLKATKISENLFGDIKFESIELKNNDGTFIKDCDEIIKNHFGDVVYAHDSLVTYVIDSTAESSSTLTKTIDVVAGYYTTDTFGFAATTGRVLLSNPMISKQATTTTTTTTTTESGLELSFIELDIEESKFEGNEIGSLLFKYGKAKSSKTHALVKATKPTTKIINNKVNKVEAMFPMDFDHTLYGIWIATTGLDIEVRDNKLNKIVSDQFAKYPFEAERTSKNHVYGISVASNDISVNDNTVSVYGDDRCTAIYFASAQGASGGAKKGNIISAESFNTTTPTITDPYGVGVINGTSLEGTKIREDHLITGATYLGTNPDASNERIEDYVDGAVN